MMQQLPDYPGKRVTRRQMQHDDFALAIAFHLCFAILARSAACGYPLQLLPQLEDGNSALADLGLLLVSKFAEITVALRNNQHCTIRKSRSNFGIRALRDHALDCALRSLLAQQAVFLVYWRERRAT